MITKQMLASARIPGNTEGVQTLIKSLRQENYTLEAVDIVLQHIAAEWPPPIPRPTMDEEKSLPFPTDKVTCAAYCAKEALYWVSYMCPPHFLVAVTSKITTHIDAIMDWLDILLWYMDPDGANGGYLLANPTMSCALLVQLSTRSGPELTSKLLSSDKFIRYAVGAWALQIEGEPWFSFSWGKERCAFCALFSIVLDHSDDSRQRALDLLCSNSSERKVLRKRIVENAVMRCEDVAKMERDDLEQRLRSQAPPGTREADISGVDTMTLYLDSVLSIVEVLCRHPLLAKRFIKAGFFEAFYEALESWLVWKSERTGPDREPRLLGFKLAARAQSVLDRHSRFDWKLCTAAHLAMLQGGLLNIIIEGIQSMPARDWENAEGLADCFRRAKELCSTSPKSAELLLPTVLRARGSAFQDTTFLADQQWAMRWRTFSYHIWVGNNVSKGDQTPTYCDSLQCPGSSSDRNRKMCSGCHSVVYCSKDCQNADWNNLHRHECREAWAEYQTLRYRGIAYTQRLRALHVRFTYQVGILTLRDQKGDANTLLRVDSWTPKCTPLTEYEGKHGFLRPRVGSPSSSQHEHHFAGRVRALTSYYAQHAAGGNLELVENKIVLGSHSVLILALLQRDRSGEADSAVQEKSEDRYKLKCCITRILPPMN